MPIRKSLHFLSVILIWDTRLATLTPGIPGFLKKTYWILLVQNNRENYTEGIAMNPWKKMGYRLEKILYEKTFTVFFWGNISIFSDILLWIFFKVYNLFYKIKIKELWLPNATKKQNQMNIQTHLYWNFKISFLYK